MSIDIAGQASAELPNPGTSIVDGLLAALPQQEAASVTLAREIGGVLFISCLPTPLVDDNPLAEVGAKEYEALLLASKGFTYNRIAAELGETGTLSIVRNRLHDAYVDLAADSISQAASFIPIDERRLRDVPVHPEDIKPGVQPLFTEPQAITFSLLGEGLSDEEVATQIQTSVQGIKRYTDVMGSLLGIDPGPKGHKIVEVRRIAVAMKNLETYATIMARVATYIQPRVIAQLDSANGQAKLGKLDLDSPVIHTINNQPLLACLEESAYVAPGTAEHGQLDLPGLVAAILINKPENQAVMKGELTRPVIREVIRQETDLFMRQRQS